MDFVQEKRWEQLYLKILLFLLPEIRRDLLPFRLFLAIYHQSLLEGDSWKGGRKSNESSQVPQFYGKPWIAGQAFGERGQAYLKPTGCRCTYRRPWVLKCSNTATSVFAEILPAPSVPLDWEKFLSLLSVESTVLLLTRTSNLECHPRLSCAGLFKAC